MSKRHYIIPIFVPHEGCPHNCVFCNQNSITGSQYLVDEDYVKNTIEQYLTTINRKNSIIEVSFFGGTFTAISAKKQIELLSVAKSYKDSGVINFIRLSTRPDYIDTEILDRLKGYAVDIIELGVQSMDNEVLKLSGRGHTMADTINASRLIKKYGFTLGHQIMIGLPGDTFQKDLMTSYESIKLKPDLCRIYPALVLRDTPMETMYRKGVYNPYTLEDTVEIVKTIYSIYKAEGINIIRVGLQATDNISETGDIIAGPNHPAFRELIEGSLICDMIFDRIMHLEGEVNIYINPKNLSKLYANKKQFFNDMKRHIKADKTLVFVSEDVDLETIIIKHNNVCCNMSINDYISKKAKAGKIDII